VSGALQGMKVETKDVVLIESRLTQSLNAFGVQVGIEFRLIHTEAGRQPHQNDGKKCSEQ
jgi:hypothetical protein